MDIIEKISVTFSSSVSIYELISCSLGYFIALCMWCHGLTVNCVSNGWQLRMVSPSHVAIRGKFYCLLLA